MVPSLPNLSPNRTFKCKSGSNQSWDKSNLLFPDSNSCCFSSFFPWKFCSNKISLTRAILHNSRKGQMFKVEAQKVSFPHHLFQSFVNGACDLLWFYRNKSYHEDNTQDALAISKTINKVLNIIMPGNWNSPLLWSNGLPAPPLWFKINFDTVIRDNFSVQAAVCRDSNGNGNIIKMIFQISGPCSSAFEKVLAAQLATSLAVLFHHKSFILKGDSLIVIMALQNPLIIQESRIFSLIYDIIDSIPTSSFWKVRKINKSFTLLCPLCGTMDRS